MAKLLSLIILVALSLIVEGINEVVFYQQPVCSGHHYAIPLGRGECRRVPDWLSEEGWNLSLDPKGHCVQVYENPSCRESIAPVSYSYSLFNSREEIVKRCKSMVELGFKSIRSFRMKPCF